MQKSPCAHHRTTLSGCIIATETCIDNRKNFLNSNISSRNISSTCPHNNVNVGPLTAEIGSGVWGTPANFNGFRVLASLLHRRVAQWRSTNLCTMFGHLQGWNTVYTFSGAVVPNGILPGAKLTLRPSLAFSCFDSVTARHQSTGRQSNFAAYTGNGIMELSLLIVFNRGRHHVGHRPTF